MKIFQDLFIHLNGIDYKELAQHLNSKCTDYWKPVVIDDIDFKKEWLRYEHIEGDGLPPAGFFLTEKEKDLWYVPNIVPKMKNELTYDEYNSLLNDFAEKVLSPAIQGLPIKIEITEPETSLQKIAGEDIAKKLKVFSSCANKSTGSSHPSDQERWFDFLCAVQKARVKLDTDMLIRLLIEQGWSEDKASELGVEYEFALALLKYSKEI